MQKPLFIILALLLFLPNLLDKDINPTLAYDKKEKFDSRLFYLNSIGKLEAHTDSIAAAKGLGTTGYEYAELLESVIEQRFYHGFSHFTLSENWIAALAGRLIKEDYACKVQPGEIMQQPNAACSQQALVMMEILRNIKINYRSVGFPHHYAMEALIDNEWYFFDANMEPGITRQQRTLSGWRHENDNLKKYYDASRFTDLDYKFGKNEKAVIGAVNEVPASRARIFHRVTGILSKILWCFPLLFIFFRPQLKAKRPFISFRVQKRKPSLSLSA